MNFLNCLREIFLFKVYQKFPVIVKEGDVVIDCGASIGITSIFFLPRKLAKTVLLLPLNLKILIIMYLLKPLN